MVKPILFQFLLSTAVVVNVVVVVVVVRDILSNLLFWSCKSLCIIITFLNNNKRLKIFTQLTDSTFLG